MSRIFEALQHAEKERSQREKSVTDHTRADKEENSDAIAIANSAHDCVQYAVRVNRVGATDFLFRLVGRYPWKCARCLRVFHRFKRYQ